MGGVVSGAKEGEWGIKLGSYSELELGLLLVLGYVLGLSLIHI